MFINLSTSFIIFFSYYIFFSTEFYAQCFPCFSSFLLLLSFSCSERLFFFFNFSVADTKLYMKHFALVRPLEVQQSNSLKAVISALPQHCHGLLVPPLLIIPVLPHHILDTIIVFFIVPLLVFFWAAAPKGLMTYAFTHRGNFSSSSFPAKRPRS